MSFVAEVDLVHDDDGVFGRPCRRPTGRRHRPARWRRRPARPRRRRPNVSSAVSLSRSPISVRGLWMPGVSTNTIWASGRVSTPRIWLRVVWGLSETIDTLRPRIRFSSVDLPDVGPTDERHETRAELARRPSSAIARLALRRRSDVPVLGLVLGDARSGPGRSGGRPSTSTREAVARRRSTSSPAAGTRPELGEHEPAEGVPVARRAGGSSCASFRSSTFWPGRGRRTSPVRGVVSTGAPPRRTRRGSRRPAPRAGPRG